MPIRQRFDINFEPVDLALVLKYLSPAPSPKCRHGCHEMSLLTSTMEPSMESSSRANPMTWALNATVGVITYANEAPRWGSGAVTSSFAVPVFAAGQPGGVDGVVDGSQTLPLKLNPASRLARCRPTLSCRSMRSLLISANPYVSLAMVVSYLVLIVPLSIYMSSI